MAKSRTKYSLRNISVGLLLQVVNAGIGLVTRPCMIRWVGLSTLSLNSLFTEVIGMISLAELGVGAAITYNLYKPIADGDENRICQLVNLYRRAYYGIAAAIFLIGCAITPIIQHIVKEVEFSNSYIQLVFFMFVCKTSLSYLFSYRLALLSADQKGYIRSLLNMAVHLVGVVAQMTVLYITRNYLYYLLVAISVQCVSNMISFCYVGKTYPFLKKQRNNMLPKEEQKEIFKNVRYLFVKKLSGKITHSTDNILISSLVSTLQVGLYNNYMVIYSIIRNVSSLMSSGINASLGNLLVAETEERSEKTLRRVNFAFFSVGLVTTCCLYGGIDTLIRLWIGEEYLLTRPVVFVTCLIIGIEFIKTPLWQILEVAGHFNRDMRISILGSSVNLVVSIILGKMCGMLGIFIGTLCTYVIQIILKIRLLYRRRLHMPSTRYYLDWAEYAVALVAGMLMVSYLGDLFSGLGLIWQLFCRVATAGILSCSALALIWLRTERFAYLKNLALRVIRRKL